MTLDELIQQVVDDGVTLYSVLLKAKVLAYNIRADNLKAWLEGEINGYTYDEDIPKYRRNIPVRSRGSLTNGVRLLRNYAVPVHLLPDNVADFARHMDVRQSISSIQSLIDRDEGDSIHVSWPSDLVALLNTVVANELNGMGYLDVQNDIGRVSLQTILDNTRSRLLTFLMELRDQYPDLDISKVISDPVQKETAQILVTNHIYGNNNTVGSGREFTQNVTHAVRDLDGLLSRLQGLGVEQKELEALEHAVIIDKKSGRSGIGDGVKSWLGSFTASVASSHVAANLPQIIAAINAFMNQ